MRAVPETVRWTVSGRRISPERRRETVRDVCAELGVSERRACRVPGQPRSTQRRPLRTAEEGEEDREAVRWTLSPTNRLTAGSAALAVQCGRYGYRRIAALLRRAVNVKRVARRALSRQRSERQGRAAAGGGEALGRAAKAPGRRSKTGRLRLGDGSCLRPRPERSNHVWAYDFVEHRTHDGRKFGMLCVVDEFTREALAILVKRRLSSSDVLEVLAEPVLARGTPSHVRSGNGPESAAVAVKAWPGNLGVNTACIEPGSPWENGHGESFDPKLRDALPDGKIFHSPKLARITVEGWRRRSNTIRPSAGCRPPPRSASPRQRSGRTRPRQSR